MPRHGQIKVTIVGYYHVSEDEIDNYGIEEFDLAKMAKIDDEEYRKHRDTERVISWFTDNRPTSVTFEAVDDDVPEC